MKTIRKEIMKYKEEMLKDLDTLVSIPSVLDSSSCANHAPFGKEIRRVFDAFAEIAESKGCCVHDDEGYAIDAQIGEGEEYIGVVAHLDVVEAYELEKWESAPFQLTQRDGMLFGRGVNDDKGPLLAALYAMHIIHEQGLPLKYPIRLIAGGAEETTWECMEHYFASHEQPICGFSPDGNFPIVNGEKGIVQCVFQFPQDRDPLEIKSFERINFVCDRLIVSLPNTFDIPATNMKETREEQGKTILSYHGLRALSRNPQRGKNAIFSFVKDFGSYPSEGFAFASLQAMLYNEFLDDDYGKKSGLYAEDSAMGTTSVCPMSLTWNAQTREVCIDIRYVKSITEEQIMKRLEEIAHTYGAKLDIIKKKKLLFVKEDSTLIQALQAAYEKVTGEQAETFSKGGASYARVLDHGVAFGATFPGEDPYPHMPNEHMSIESLCKACEIYYEALCLLAVDESKV